MEKLTSYLLVERAWDDKSKFLSKAGFTRENPHLLLQSIRDLAATLAVVTIWLRAKSDGQVRFITLKPWKEKKP